MLYLKKYFTEGLIQFTVLLSLVGVRVDVDTYLPPPGGILSGPTPACARTRSQHLRDTPPHGYGTHPKSARLVTRLGALRHLRVPSTELSAWLVHRDPDAAGSAPGQSSPGVALDDGSGPGASAMRGPAGASESSPGGGGGGPGAAAPDTGELSKEDVDLIDVLWRQDVDLGAGREAFNYGGRQKDGETDGRGGGDGDAGDGARPRSLGRVDGETGESVPEQLSSLGAQTSMSLQECLRLLEATFPFGEEPEFQTAEAAPGLRGSAGGVASTSRAPPPPAPAPQPDVPLDLEQQWQDIMAIMELQDMEVNGAGDAALNDRPSDTAGRAADGFAPPPSGLINEDVSLHQASLPSCSQDLFNPELDPRAENRPALLGPASSDPSDGDAPFGVANLTGLFLPPPLNAPALPDPFCGLLEESMLDEISLLDLAMEEGFSHAQASRLEDELDSDSGLSLDSPSDSEASCSSAASSSSSSTSTSTSATFSEEGAVGYGTDSEEGAVGGSRGPGHNHTYNLPPRPEQPRPPGPAGKKPKDKQLLAGKLQAPPDLLDKQWSRDERRARALKIPFSNEKIINLPVEEFNELLSEHRLGEAQLALVRDIRRRGKNKMAAQNCRKRKLDTILNLERGVQELRRERARLLKEKADFLGCLAQTKQKVRALHQEVLGQLRDERGRPYSPGEYSLRYGVDGSVSLQRGRKPDKKQKDKKK